jgi:hypothetical protein
VVVSRVKNRNGIHNRCMVDQGYEFRILSRRTRENIEVQVIIVKYVRQSRYHDDKNVITGIILNQYEMNKYQYIYGSIRYGNSNAVKRWTSRFFETLRLLFSLHVEIT